MQYQGGKERISKQIVEFLERQRVKDQLFVDLTVGGGSVITKMSGQRLGIDINKSLITLYNSILASNSVEHLPDVVSKSLFMELRTKKDFNDPLTAFVGFGCSYAGIFFQGFAVGANRNYALCAKNSLKRKWIGQKGLKIDHGNLFDFTVRDAVIYIDPPYKSTTPYRLVNFDYDKFWDKVRELSLYNKVYVSEYEAPEDFKCVLEIEKTVCLGAKRVKKTRKIEKLFTYLHKE